MTKKKHDFLRAMRESEKELGPIRVSKATLSSFIEKSKQVKNSKPNSSNLKKNAKAKDEEPSAISQEDLHRLLKFYEGFDEYKQAKDFDPKNFKENMRRMEEAMEDEVSNSTSSSGSGHSWWKFWTNFKKNNATYSESDEDGDGDGDDDAVSAAEQNYYDYQNADNSTLQGLENLSIKYAGCSSPKSINFDGDGMTYTSSTLIQYRLCPSDSCTDDSWKGCNDEFGEYMMEMSDFLDIQTELHEYEIEQLCNYCEQCLEYNSYSMYFCNSGDDDGADCMCSQTDTCSEYSSVCDYKNDDDGDDNADDNADDALDYLAYDDLFECTQVYVNPNQRRQLYWWSNNNKEDKNAYNYFTRECNQYYDNYEDCMEEGEQQYYEWEQRKNGNNQNGNYQNGNYNNNNYNNNNYNNNNNNNNNNNYYKNFKYYDDSSSYYVGVHCDGMHLMVALFSDENCANVVMTDRDADIASLTGTSFNTETLEEFYVPEGCVKCGGEEYNVSRMS